jgi:tetraacyldisaccharide 4'-kinase
MNVRDAVLIPASGVLELVNRGAGACYRRGLLRVERASVPVISVGNITLGGTGKTPLVAALARTLLAAGARPAVLTRGYRRRDREPVLIWRQPAVAWGRGGDEATVLARALPEVPIVVDADRVRGAATAVRETGATHLVLDDGFQHWRLHRDLDIVTVTANDPLGARVPRREAPGALGRAHALVLSRASDRTEVFAAMGVLGPYAPAARILATTLAARAVHIGGERRPPEALRDRDVVALAGIAAPAAFVDSLGDLGARPVELRFFPDHHRYSRNELGAIVQEAEAAGALVVTTAKDFVKIPADLGARIAWLEVEAVPLWGSFTELLAPVLGS